MSFVEEIKFRIWLTVHELSLKQIKLWQKKKAKQIIKHALHTVPLYKKLWGTYGVNDERSLVLEKLPIISKRTFIGNDIKEYVARGLPESYYKKFGHTAGSTGEPIRFIRAVYGNGHTETEEKYFNAKQLRFLLWDNVSFKKIVDSIKVIELKGGSKNNKKRLFMPIAELRKDTKRFLQKVEEFRPDVIAGYSTFVLELAEAAAKSGLKNLIKVPYVIMGGQALKLEEKNFIKEVLQSDVYTRYSFEEFRAVGMECKYHDGFHLHAESFIFEVVDDMGNPVSPGKSGRIIITDLYNRAMPFIRYDTGDYGRIDKARCRCGLWTPRLFLEQMPAASLSFGQKRIGRGDINKILGKHVNAITQYQIHKLSHNNVEVLIVPGELFNEHIKQKLDHEIKELVGNGVGVKITKSKNILSGPGKQQIFLDLTQNKK